MEIVEIEEYKELSQGIMYEYFEEEDISINYKAEFPNFNSIKIMQNISSIEKTMNISSIKKTGNYSTITINSKLRAFTNRS